jgi:hypothetical protein
MRYRLLASISLAALMSLGCKESKPCDPTTYYNGQACLPYLDAAALAPPTDASVSLDAAAAPVDDAVAAESGGSASTVKPGDPCVDNITHSDCQGPSTDYCAVQPGQPGYCTKTGCTATDTSLCPQGWSCFNVGQFMPGQPWICLKP